MKKFFNEYLNKDIKLEKYQIVGIIALVIVFSGIFGWFYEYIFYFFNGGMKEWYWQGGNFLPWINIYAQGSILIILMTYKFRKKPHIVFILSMFVTGVLEYISGWLIYTLQDGTRYWNYNVEILNYGNLDGFVCFRSILVFGLCAFFLMYVLLPLFIYLAKKMNKKVFLTISIGLCSLFLFDEIYNLVLTKIFNTPKAIDIYTKLGFKFLDF